MHVSIYCIVWLVGCHVRGGGGGRQRDLGGVGRLAGRISGQPGCAAARGGADGAAVGAVQ